MSIAVTGVSDVTFQLGFTRLPHVNDGLMAYANVEPPEATNQAIEWSASNPSVIYINPSTGFMKAVGYGTTDIIATSVDGGFVKSAPFGVGVDVTGISTISGATEVDVNYDITLHASALPSNAINKAITWSSNNESVATVDPNTGVVTGQGIGSATITATTVDGGFSTTQSIIVAGISDITFTTDHITFTNDISLPNRQMYAYAIATILPIEAQNQTITWSSSNPNVIGINTAGYFYSAGYGTATITATTADGKLTKTFDLIVGVPTTGISDIKNTYGETLPSSIQILPNSSMTISAFVLPENAYNGDYEWSSDNPDIASISTYGGQITGINYGTTTLRITSGSFTKSIECQVVSEIPVSGLSESPRLTDSRYNVVVDGVTYIKMNGINYYNYEDTGFLNLWVDALPRNATADKSLTYSVGNPNILRVDIFGRMFVKPDFTAASGAIQYTTVTVTSVSNPDVSAVYNIQVINPDITTTFIHSRDTNFNLTIGSSGPLLELWSVADNAPLVTNGPISFEFSDQSLAFANPVGYDLPYDFYGFATGDVTVYAYYANYAAKCVIHVINACTYVTDIQPLLIAPSADASSSTTTFSSIGNTGSYCFSSVIPSNATNTTILYTSSNEDVITIDSNSKELIAVGPGTATITATTDDGEYTSSVIVTVDAITAITELTDITTEYGFIPTLRIGASMQLLAEIRPFAVNNKKINWYSSVPDVATISDSGVVTGVTNGSTIITATSDSDSSFTKSITLYVDSVSAVTGIKPIVVTGAKYNPATNEYFVGSLSTVVNVSTDLLPSFAYPRTNIGSVIIWESSNTDAISPWDDYGVSVDLKLVDYGTSILTAISELGNHTQTVKITVTNSILFGISDISSPNGVTSIISRSRYHKNTLQLSASVLPLTLANPPAITWTSSNTDIATVSSTGLVTSNSSGRVTITASVTDGTATYSSTFDIEVDFFRPVTSLTEITAPDGGIGSFPIDASATVQLSTTAGPFNATDKTISWSTTNDQVAIVNSSGVVTYVGDGRCDIIATAGSISDSIMCVAYNPVEVASLSISPLISNSDYSTTIDGVTYIVINGVNYQNATNTINYSLNVEALPANATNKSLTYTVENSNVLTVDEYGRLSATPNFSLASGAITNTTVTVTSVSNPSATATYHVRVINPDVTSTFIRCTRPSNYIGLGFNAGITLELCSVDTNAPLVTSSPAYMVSSNSSVFNVSIMYDGSPNQLFGFGVGDVTVTAYYENKVARTTMRVRDESAFISVESVSGNFVDTIYDSTRVNNYKVNESDTYWTSDVQTINEQSMFQFTPENASVIVESTLSRNDIFTIDSTGKISAVPKAPGVPYNTTDYTDVTVKILKWDSVLTYTYKMRLDIVTTGYELNYAINSDSVTLLASADSPTAIYMKQLQEGSDSIDVWYDFGSGSVMTNLGYVPGDVVWSTSDSLTTFTFYQNANVFFGTIGNVWVRCIIGGKYVAEKQYTINDPNAVTGMTDIVITDRTAYESGVGDPVTLTDTSFNFGTVTVIEVTAYTLPAGTNKPVTYTSSDPGVLQFREIKGQMTNIADILSARPVTITASYESFSSTVTLTITNPFVAVTGIDSLKTAANESVSFNLYPDSPVTLSTTVYPSDATDKTITWATDNPLVATVVNGVVTYVGDGTCNITATAGEFSASIECVASVPVASIADISAGSTSIAPGSSLQLSSIISPPEATNKTINWAIATPVTGVTISSNGELSVAPDVTSVTSINVTATAAGNSSKTKSITISVYYAVSSVSSLVGDGAATSISPAGSLQLSCTVSPSYATNKNVTWSVDSAAEAAGITVIGGLLAVPANVTTVTSITVTATSADNANKSTTASFSVVYPTTTISEITASKYTISPGENLSMSCTVGPSYASNKSIKWSVNVVSSIAAINNDGTLSLASDATGATSIIVTATAASNSNLTKTKKVDIYIPVTSINPITTSAANGFAISANSTIQLACSVNPAGATNKKINWSIDVTNPTIASITPNGYVTIGSLIPPSLTTITVTATADGDNTKFATESLYFPTAVQSLSLIGAPSSSVRPGESLQLTCTTNPPNASNNKIKWLLNVAPSIATITPTTTGGLLDVAPDVTNVSSIIVTATSDADSTKTQTRSFSIYYPVSSVNSITTGTGVNRVIPGVPLALSTSVNPSYATDKGVRWSIDAAPSVANISTSGVLTIVSTSLPLSATSIIATATAVGDNTKTNTLEIPVYYPVSSISIAATGGTTIPVGSTATLVPTIVPSYATNKTLTWTSASSSVSIDTSGDSVIATGVTETTSQVGVTATSVDGPSRTINLNVGAIPITDMTLATFGDVASMSTGATLNMIATISPSDASDKSVAWSLTSLPAGIATIDENGQINTLANTNGGTITVKATPSISRFAKTITLSVFPALTGFSTTIADFSAVLGVNNIRSISLNPSGASNRTFSATVTNLSGTNVATVTNINTAGLTVVGNNIGSARITLTANADSTITTSFVITVTGTPVSKLNAVTISPSTVKATAVDNNAIIVLSSSTNAEASNKNIIWTCDDSTITVVPSGSNSSTNSTSSCTVTCVNSDYKKTKTVTIVGTSQSNPTVTVRQNLTIKAAPKPAITITTSPTVNVKTLDVGNTLTVRASVTNSNSDIIWSSNTPLLATVTSDGIVTGVKAGSATIKATLSSDSTISATYAITVKNVVPSSISMSSTNVVLTSVTSTGANGTVALSASNPSLIATVNPSNVTVPGVNWSLTPAGFATINTSGQLTLIKPTTTGKPITVTAKTKGAPAKSFAVKLTITNA